MKKYELTEETITIGSHTLHRVIALIDFGSVKKNDIGGWIENYRNLDQCGNAWVFGNAWVYGNAQVFGNAQVCGDAWVYDDAKVCGNAKVFGNAWVYGNAQVFGNAQVCGDAQVYVNAQVFGNAKVFGNAWVYGNAQVFGNAQVCGDAQVYVNAQVFGNAQVCGDAKVCGNADYIVFKNWWSSGRHFTWSRSNNMWRVGCFYGTGEELIIKAYKDSEVSGREYERVVRYVESILKDEKNS